jgi:tetratricopeptide (TPR) repeat protein
MRWLAALLLIHSLALPQTPNQREAGDQAAAQGKFDEAARHYEAFARADPSEENLFFLGSFLLNHNGFEPARTTFEFAAAKYPKSIRIAVGLGIAEYSLGHYDEAVKKLCAAVDLDPGDSRAIQFLGKMHDVSPAYAGEVTRRLEQLVRTYPNNASANYYYALCLLGDSAENLAQGEQYLRRAAALDPSNVDVHYQLGLVLEKLNKPAESISEFKLVIGQKPNTLKAHYRLAQLYRRTGQEALAKREFILIERLKKLGPK